MTDSSSFLLLLKNNEKTKQHLYSIITSKERFSLRRPKDWNSEIINMCLERINTERDMTEKVTDTTLLFYFYSVREGLKKGVFFLKPLLEVPVTHKHKFLLSFFHSSYMLYKFLHESERSTLADMKKHFKAVPKTSLYYYYISLVMIKYLENDLETTMKYLKKAEEELRYYEKSGLGFWKLERTLFQSLQEKIASPNKMTELSI